MAHERSLQNEHLNVMNNPPGCVFFRSKAMYVTGRLSPDHVDESAGSHQDYCWCNMTQHVIGPDEVIVKRHECVDGRGCFKASY
ncbi:hypothetical protein [Lignipirellula cremea]|uniref:Uncharacterized protein n=1 Tax=Lignipirellula cremea TaxID=2528010 RepID=A0A518DTB5_9BACT|nr:hypothetical protein [Lignipirellula cremea]QDU95086.1 hypothetical protein Pla8534_28980 [Lignipirellula cremea]